VSFVLLHGVQMQAIPKQEKRKRQQISRDNLLIEKVEKMNEQAEQLMQDVLKAIAEGTALGAKKKPNVRELDNLLIQVKNIKSKVETITKKVKVKKFAINSYNKNINRIIDEMAFSIDPIKLNEQMNSLHRRAKSLSRIPTITERDSLIKKLKVFEDEVMRTIEAYKHLKKLKVLEDKAMRTIEAYKRTFPVITDYWTEKPIVVVVCSYNNKDWYKKNLDSIFSQNYSNYRVVYIDDASPDGTGDLVERYIQEKGQTHRVMLVKNKERMFKMSNFYQAVHMYCSDDDIVFDYDGDDWFKHNNVLAIVNRAYSDQNIWSTYGSFITFPDNKMGGCEEVPGWVIEKNAYRDYRWVTTHQRTFYAWLFKLIKLENFLYDGRFIKTTADLAYMFPILEMSGGRCEYIRDILYVYNIATPINDSKIRRECQSKMNRFIRRIERYSKLDAPMLGFLDHFKNCSAHLLVCSNDDPSNLRRFLEAVHLKMSGIEKISVVYTASSDDFRLQYQRIADYFAGAAFIDAGNDFKSSLLSFIDASDSYIVLAHDKCVIENDVDVAEAILIMEETRAYAFFFNTDHREKIFSSVRAGDLAFAWQFKFGGGHWKKPYNLDLTLYRKEDIADKIKRLVFSSQQELEGKMLQLDNPHEMGCFFR